MTEKNILAYFTTPEQAKRVAERLGNMGFQEIQVDHFSRLPGDDLDLNTTRAISQAETLSELVTGVTETGPDSGVLLAADPVASGMSSGGTNLVDGYNIILTAVVDERRHEEALQVVREMGGLV